MEIDRQSTRVKKGAIALFVSGVVEQGLQLMAPMILVRMLDQAEFGDYRLIWLVVATAAAVFTFAVPSSLMHFLPKSCENRKRAYTGNALVFLCCSGCVAAIALALVWHWRPLAWGEFAQYEYLVPLFVSLWIASSLMDCLPAADGRPTIQAAFNIMLAILRLASIIVVAATTHAVTPILVAMCIYGAIKVSAIPLYAVRLSTFRGLAINFGQLMSQLKYVLPFAIGNSLFLLRLQADQWIAATLLSIQDMALVSIASFALTYSVIIRQPLITTTLPKLSSLIGDGDIAAACSLLRRTYAVLCSVLLPVLALMYVITYDLVEMLYTANYLAAAAPMRVYILAQASGAFAAGHLLVIMNLGRLAYSIAAVSLCISVAISLLAIQLFGLVGACFGTVASLYVGELWSLWAVKRKLGVKPSEILDLSTLRKVVMVSALSVSVTLMVRQYLSEDWELWTRLITTIGVFTLIIAISGRWMGLDARLKVLLQHY